MRHITIIAGARPNFMKIAPIIHAVIKHNENSAAKLDFSLVHTGQHYDQNMSGSFFEDLNIPQPDYNLGVGSGTQGEQTAKIIIEFEKLLTKIDTSLVVVVGDVNSTMACSIVAKKLLIPVAHVEAGLRSGDMAMPEEINRLITDRISDLLFTTDPIAEENLKKEGVPSEKIIPVGNVMIDTLIAKLEDAKKITAFDEFKKEGNYALLTLHRPSNVDDKETLSGIFSALQEITKSMRIIFPCHPRTEKMIASFGLELPNGIHKTPPLPYIEMLSLTKDAKVVLTDSGGLQEESSALGIPCITIRENTERPVTVSLGTNQVIGTKPENIIKAFESVKDMEKTEAKVIPLWEGKASERIIVYIAEWLNN